MQSDSQRIDVLLIDEDPEFVDQTATFLERENERFVIETATSTKAGLNYLDAHDIDCIVAEYDLPRQTGIELLEAVRRKHPDLPFILFTGKGSEEVASEALSAGATDYLQKQVGTEQYELLANRIHNAVNQYRSNKRAQDLERIHTLIANIHQELVLADNQSLLEQRICKRFTAAEPYRFAWIGEIDEENDVVRPRTLVGIEKGYLDAIEIAVDDSPKGRGPTGKAVKTGKIAVQQNIPEDEEYEPWRGEAMKRGYQSSAAVPLVRNNTSYGVLNVYADRRYAFDDKERNLLAELGDDIAHALARIENERELHRYEAAVEGATDSLVAADENRRVLFANEHFREFFGRSEGELCGSHVREIVGEQEYENIKSLFERSLDGERVRFIRDISTNENKTHTFDIHFYPLFARGGDEITGVVASLRNITEHEVQKRKLREFKQAVDAAGQAIYITDSNGEITYTNQGFEAITGYSPGEAIGRNPRILKSGEMSDGYYEELWKTIMNGEIWEDEVINRRKNGELYYALLTIAPVTNDAGDIEAYVAIQTNLTERKKRENHLLALDRMLRHNLRNEMNVVLGRASMIAEEGSPAVAEYATAIQESVTKFIGQAEKEREIVQLLVDPPIVTTVDLSQRIRLVKERLHDQYPKALFEVAIPDELRLQTIPEIERAIEELLENAIVHSEEHPSKVRIAITERDDTVEIEVSDTNPPIPSEERAVITDITQIDALMHMSGMGLWLVKLVVKRANGKLMIEQRESQGNRITMIIPI